MTSFLPALDGVFGDRPDAVIIDGRSTSWADLVTAADRVVARIGGARAVAVPAPANLDTLIAVVAGLRAGVPVVPIPHDSGPAERAHILRDSGADLEIGAGLAVTELEASAAEPTSAALIMYTSGTTGPPKGVLLGTAALGADLDKLAEAWGWTADDTLVHGLPLFHVHGLVLGTLGALRVGSRVVHSGRPTAEAYAAAGGSMYFGVPTVWSRVCTDPLSAAALRKARLLVSGSAALPARLSDQLRDLAGQAPVERYGMTETLITVSSRVDGERRAGLVGTVLEGVQTRITGDDGSVLPDDGETIGELQVRTPTMFDGYLGRPDATAACWTADGWFRTGDVAAIGPDGWHRIVGRASVDLIKSGGYRIGAGEVEAALREHPGVSEAAVVGIPDDDLGQRIVAYVVADGVEPAALVDFVAQGLSVHKRPREVRLVDALPRNALGKVQKNLLGH